MIRLLFLVNNLSGGGAERVLVNLVNEMPEDKYDITVRTLSYGGVNKQYLKSTIHYESVLKKSFRGENYLYLLPHKWIYKKIIGGTYDIVIVYLHGVLTRIVSYAPKTQKTIAYLHANMEKSPFIRKFHNKAEMQKCFANYRRIVSVSEEVQHSFIRVSGINDNRLVVKYNTFDVKGIEKKAVETINKGIVPGKVNLCSIGKLEEVKGYERLLKVINNLKNFNVHLSIIGEGTQRAMLEEYINRNQLTKVVDLIGFDSNPYKYLSKSDLFVCSSYSEGFSSVVAESMILGIPVLTTDCAGMREMLGENNEYGIIVKNSTEGIEQGLKDLLENPDKIKYYQKKARERSSFFNTNATVGAVEKMIEEVINES